MTIMNGDSGETWKVADLISFMY